MISKILIVDDSPVARKMLKHCIPKEKGYEIYEAVNGQDAIQKHDEINPELTFMDLTMPVMDGFKASEIIRNKIKDAIIVVTSADIQLKSADRISGMGVFAILKKPPKPHPIQEVLEKVEKQLQNVSEKRQ